MSETGGSFRSVFVRDDAERLVVVPTAEEVRLYALRAQQTVSLGTSETVPRVRAFADPGSYLYDEAGEAVAYVDSFVIETEVYGFSVLKYRARGPVR